MTRPFDNLNDRLIAHQGSAHGHGSDGRQRDSADAQRTAELLAQAAADLSDAAKALRDAPTVGVVRE